MPVLLWLFLVVVLLAVSALLWFVFRRWSQVRFIRNLLRNGRHRAGSNRRRVIAALSTLPDRIANLDPTIQCLISQTRPPDEIVIAVPEFSLRQQTHYIVPEYLAQYPTVRILRCVRDWGPATKFIPVVQEELAAGRGDTLIMVLDDDRTYPCDALETYLHYHLQLPDAALCFRGSFMPPDFVWHRAKTLLADRIREPEKVAVVTGCGSYLIQPRFFDAQLWDYSAAPGGAFYMDDIWISGWLDRGKIDKYVVPASAMMRTVPQQRRTMTLHDVPHGRRQNNDEVIAFFRDTWKLFSLRLLDRFRKRGRKVRVDGS
jgi:Glycosyl transferase family 2